MAGGMRKMAVYLGLVEDDPDLRDDGYDDYDDRGGRSDVRVREDRGRLEETRAQRPVAVRDEPPAVRTFRDEPRTAARDTPRAPVRSGPVTPAEPYRITTIHPRAYNDARRIGEEFRAGTPVIMSLIDMDDGDAKRIVDFAAGLIFGLQGSIERVTNKVFLLSPANVDVRAEVAAQLAEDGFFNQS